MLCSKKRLKQGGAQGISICIEEHSLSDIMASPLAENSLL